MAEEKEKKQKNITVTFEREAETPVTYSTFLLRPYENKLEIDLAEKHETENEINLIVRQAFAVSSDQMFRLWIEMFYALRKYEDTYHNGKGIPKQPET